MRRKLESLKKFKLNSVMFGGVITEKNKMTRGYYGQIKDRMFLFMIVNDIPNNPIRLLFEEQNAVYALENYKEGDYIAVTGAIQRDTITNEMYIRVTQMALPVDLHLKRIEKEVEVLETSMDIEEMMKGV